MVYPQVLLTQGSHLKIEKTIPYNEDIDLVDYTLTVKTDVSICCWYSEFTVLFATELRCNKSANTAQN